MKIETRHERSSTRFILLAGLMVGTLDGTAAVIDFVLSTHRNPAVVFRYIASGLAGTNAFSGGHSFTLLGVVLHYLIAMSWTAAFFLLYPKTKMLRGNPVGTGVLYACVVWLVMNLAVRPLSRVPTIPWTLLRVTKSYVILILAVGLPVTFTASKYYAASELPADGTGEASEDGEKSG